MLTHIVFFKLKNPSQTILYDAKNRIESLQAEIPILRYLEVGIDILGSVRSFDIALVTRFDSLQDMLAYQVHPAHVDVAEFMKSICEKSVTVDYE